MGEVFWRETPFGDAAEDFGAAVARLHLLASDADLRKSERTGYYFYETGEGAGNTAQLPVPQLTISNYETLALNFCIPKVAGAPEKLAVRISLADAAGNAYTALTLDETAIYRTYSYGDRVVDQAANALSAGVVYTVVLDTPDPALDEDTVRDGALSQYGALVPQPPMGKFAAWAKRSAAFGGFFKLGDDVRADVTVFGLTGDGTAIDDTVAPRTGYAVFNGWFGASDGTTATIACGRHLQNLGKLTEATEGFAAALPAADYSGGSAYAAEGSNYRYRSDVQKITAARQVADIDLGCEEWTKGGERIPFEPIALPPAFTYYGNFFSVRRLHADAPFYAGLFGYGYGAKLYDIRLVDPDVGSRMPAAVASAYEMGVGALLGTGIGCELAGCQVYAEAGSGAGGSSARVQGAGVTGGLVGYAEGGSITQCSASVATGRADGSSACAGGLVGCLAGTAVAKSYAAGSVIGVCAGGLAGTVKAGAQPAEIVGCYAAGHITGAGERAAGLVGQIEGSAEGGAAASLSADGNYCAVVYGESADGTYVWGSAGSVYGTFEGDGAASQKNYYIPQKGIAYAGSGEGANALYSAAALRKVCAEGGFGGFEYDYGKIEGYSGQSFLTSPTYADGSAGDGNGGCYFVDTDHGVYNNVLPYAERGGLTKFYPYPMISGRGVMTGGAEGEKLSGVMFHYGDWLTEDLIAEAPEGYALEGARTGAAAYAVQGVPALAAERRKLCPGGTA